MAAPVADPRAFTAAKICVSVGFAWLLWGTAGLGDIVSTVVLAAGLVLVVVVFAALRGADAGGSPVQYGRGFWIVVATEGAAVAVGLVLMHGPLDEPGAAAGVVAIVVGVHFAALAHTMQASRLRPVGLLITLAGVAGVITAFAGGSDDGATTAAALPTGVVLIGAALDVLARRRRASTSA